MQQKIRQNRRTNLAWLDLFCRWLLAVIFVVAALPKLFAPGDFSRIISMYGILPDELLSEAAVILPVLELITAVGLLLGRRWALILVTAQMGLFISVLAYGINLGLDIDCGCFGPEDPEHGAVSGLRTALFRDVLLMIPVVYSWWFLRSRKCHMIKES